ncbi:hypothetical protein [Candidatus Symbiothrix dinenymphae]|uniref:hypothetical protein n=1 Tax=Candidatus Symbiothrix dinenymphae TaxID=467085 RepID=UPI000703A5B1|nr:hypothetical protein [Candidatus Symbiothrix dinenymphae]
MKKLVVFSLALLALCGCNGKESHPTVAVPHQELPPPTVNVYIENSGSMDGYVRGMTDMEKGGLWLFE